MAPKRLLPERQALRLNISAIWFRSMQFLRRSQSMLRRRPLLRGTRSHPQVVLSLSWPTRRICTSSSVVEGWLKDWETTKKDSGWMGKHMLALLEPAGLKVKIVQYLIVRGSHISMGREGFGRGTATSQYREPIEEQTKYKDAH